MVINGILHRHITRYSCILMETDPLWLTDDNMSIDTYGSTLCWTVSNVMCQYGRRYVLQSLYRLETKETIDMYTSD